VSWIPLGAWLAAVAIAVVLLGFCAHEITWRARRLRRDLGRLQGLGDELSRLQGEIAAGRQRLARTGVR
jgi:hypothetical protein